MEYTAKLATEPVYAKPESFAPPITNTPPVAADVPAPTRSPFTYNTTSPALNVATKCDQLPDGTSPRTDSTFEATPFAKPTNCRAPPGVTRMYEPFVVSPTCATVAASPLIDEGLIQPSRANASPTDTSDVSSLPCRYPAIIPPIGAGIPKAGTPLRVPVAELSATVCDGLSPNCQNPAGLLARTASAYGVPFAGVETTAAPRGAVASAAGIPDVEILPPVPDELLAAT